MESFRLHNIKSFKDSGDIEIKPITIILGKNSTGKSSLIRFPIVLKQTLNENIAPLLFYGKLLDYGNFEDVVFLHQENLNLSFSLKFSERSLRLALRRFYPPHTEKIQIDDDLTLTVEVGRSTNQRSFWADIVIKKLSINVGENSLFFCELISESKYSVEMFGENLCTELIFNNFIPQINLEAFHSLKEDNENERLELLRSTRYILRAIEMMLDNTINQIDYLGPFRRTPDRNYRYQQAGMPNLGADGEYTSEVLASYHKKGDTAFFNSLNNWLSKHLRVQIYVEELGGGMYRIQVQDLDTGVTNNIRDVGFGLSQVLPIIVQVFIHSSEGKKEVRTNRGALNFFKRINIIEQPELHLHPAAQSLLADLFIAGNNADRRNHYIIETHSEHLLLRLRRRILEKKVKSSNVAIYFVEKQGDVNEGSFVRKLNIDNDGFIEDWPEDFFDQDYKEVIAINKLRASIRKENEEW